MKYYIFHRRDNDFTDILTDPSLKKLITERIKWNGYLQIGIDEYNNEKIFIYIALKYSDDMCTDLIKDRTPIIHIDYTPRKIQ